MKIIVQNLATEYLDEGTGPVILFLHGWQDSLRTWNALVGLLPGHRIVMLDLPGFGGTEMPKEPWNLDNYIQFVKDFSQKLNLNVDVLVGHSFGGRIIIKGLATGNLRAGKAVLIDSAGVSKNKKLRNLILKIIAKTGGAVMLIPPLSFWREKLRRKIYGKLGSDFMGVGALKETFLKIIAEDISLSAGKVKCPVLLIWGANDSVTPLADGEWLSKLILGSKLKVIDNAGHMVHQQKPEEVAGLIKEFYAQ